MNEFLCKLNGAAKSVFGLAKDFWELEYSAEILAAAAIIIAALVIARELRKKYAPIKLFTNSAGVVTVSRRALDELVQSVCYAAGTLNRPSVKIYSRRKRLCMRVSIKLEAGQKLAETSAELQEELTNACREQLGVEKLGKIDVEVKGFKGILKKPAKKFDPLKIDDNSDGGQSNTPFSSPI